MLPGSNLLPHLWYHEWGSVVKRSTGPRTADGRALIANQNRRDRLRDGALTVLAEAGGRGLTHRAVDAAAGVPDGTTKNYFPTRDALLSAVAERILELYRAAAERAAAGAPPAGREALIALLRGLLEDVAGPGRPRLQAYLELQAAGVALLRARS